MWQADTPVTFQVPELHELRVLAPELGEGAVVSLTPADLDPLASWGLENMVLLGKRFQNRDVGESRDPNGLYGTEEVLGRGGFPKFRQTMTSGVFLVGPPRCVSVIDPLCANGDLFPLFGVSDGFMSWECLAKHRICKSHSSTP